MKTSMLPLVTADPASINVKLYVLFMSLGFRPMLPGSSFSIGRLSCAELVVVRGRRAAPLEDDARQALCADRVLGRVQPDVHVVPGDDMPDVDDVAEGGGGPGSP